MKVIAASEIHGSAELDDKALKAALSQYLASPPRRIDRLIFQAARREDLQDAAGALPRQRQGRAAVRGACVGVCSCVCLRACWPN